MKSLGARLPPSTFSLALLGLLALPFAAMGTAAAYLTLRTLLSVMLMQGWPTVPATLQDVELKASGQHAERAVASYTYLFDGKPYAGKRVSLYGADNLGSFQHDAYQDLHDHLARRAPYPVHVNPKAPTESILMPVLRWEVLGFELVFVVLFGGAGWGLLAASVLKLRKMRLEAALVRRYPNEPWMHRVEWAGPRIRSSQGADALGESFLAVFWNVATFPILLIVPREVANGRYVALTFLVIPLAGLGLAYWAIVELARTKRFGRTSLHLDTMPGRPGQELRGHIDAPAALQGASGVALNLRCEKQYGVSSRRGARNATEPFWATDVTAPVLAGQSAAGDAVVAVAIAIPPGLPDSSRGGAEEYAWYLSASAPLPGADFAAEFEIPVFRNRSA